MKTKYFIIYMAVGAAFMAVSLWVFLTGGTNAKAIRAKYKLGGIMLTAWAMISFVSCQAVDKITDPGELIMCYDPVEPAPTENIVSLKINSSRPDDGYNKVGKGDSFSVKITNPVSSRFVLMIYLYDREKAEKTILQQNELLIEDPEKAEFEVPFDDTIEYKGEAWLDVYCDKDGNLQSIPYGTMIINII